MKSWTEFVSPEKSTDAIWYPTYEDNSVIKTQATYCLRLIPSTNTNKA